MIAIKLLAFLNQGLFVMSSVPSFFTLFFERAS
jgi:hypothetical protein